MQDGCKIYLASILHWPAMASAGGRSPGFARAEARASSVCAPCARRKNACGCARKNKKSLLNPPHKSCTVRIMTPHVFHVRFNIGYIILWSTVHCACALCTVHSAQCTCTVHSAPQYYIADIKPDVKNMRGHNPYSTRFVGRI